MSDIKMEDMLVLPVKRTPGGIMPFLKDGNDEVMFVGSRYHVDLCVTAINAYDANQERIVELDELRKGSMNCIRQQREEITMQQQEIAELKAELEQHDDQITNIEIANQEMLAAAGARINKRVDENNGLKAKIELMRDISLSSNYDDIYHLIEALADAINKTPQQCLSNVKADAGKAGFYEGFSRSGEGFNDEYGCEPIELKTMANLYASELKEQNKGE